MLISFCARVLLLRWHSYGNGSLTVRIVQRVFSGCGKRNDCRIEDRLGYTDFVWFCLSEEDKRSARSLEYWFK